MESGGLAALIEEREGSRLILEEFHELGRGAAKLVGGPLRIMASLGQNVESLGEESGKVLVFGVHDDPAAPAPAEPEIAAGGTFRPVRPVGCSPRGPA